MTYFIKCVNVKGVPQISCNVPVEKRADKAQDRYRAGAEDFVVPTCEATVGITYKGVPGKIKLVIL